MGDFNLTDDDDDNNNNNSDDDSQAPPKSDRRLSDTNTLVSSTQKKASGSSTTSPSWLMDHSIDSTFINHQPSTGSNSILSALIPSDTPASSSSHRISRQQQQGIYQFKPVRTGAWVVGGVKTSFSRLKSKISLKGRTAGIESEI